MPYFREIKTLLIHIPKTGGTSIEHYFHNNFNVKLNYNNVFSNMKLTYNGHSLQHCTYKELYNDMNNFDINFDDIKIITVVRNPYDRIISCLFYNKLITVDMNLDEIYEQLKIFIESNDIKYDNHKLPQYLYLLNNDYIIDKNIIIMKTETLTQDMINNGYIDFDIKLNVTNKNKIDYMKLLNNDAIKLINNYYMQDFMYFNYKYIISNKPTFICIGAQKAGTTSFINYMNQHPSIYMYDKELHFFDTQELNKESIIEYEKNFKPPNNKFIIGEKTPSLYYLQYSIDRIYDYDPNMKLVLILREPISRAYSQYNMDNSNIDSFLDNIIKYKDINLKDIKSNKENPYNIVRGFYNEHIEYILSKFPKENLYIGISEEIKNNKNYEYNKIFNFLGCIENINIDITQDTRIGKYEKNISNNDAKVLYNIYKPHNEKLYNILGRKIDIWEKYYESLL